MSLSKLFQRIIWHNNTTPAINEDNLNAMSKAIDDIDDRVILIGDDVVTVIPQIQAYLEQAEDLVEAMEQLSQNPPYIGANGNWYVFNTSTEQYEDSGVDASITVDIADITMIAEGAQPYVTNSGTNTDPVFHLFLPRSPQGATGNGISNIAKTSTQGLVDTYTITMTDGTTYTFTVTNGQGIGDMTKAVYDSTNAVADAGGIADYIEGEIEALPYTNPNLLDNPWFTVNQRGATSATTIWTYFVDRWRTGNNAYNLVINNDKTITFKAGGNTEINQGIEYDRFNLGKVYTLSVMLSDGTIRSVSGVIEQKSQWTRLFAVKLSDTDDIWAAIDADQNYVAASIYANTDLTVDLTIKAVKLELGSVSTLAQDTAPNYAQELLKCQRYFYRVHDLKFLAVCSRDARPCMVINFPIEMRATPNLANALFGANCIIVCEGTFGEITAIDAYEFFKDSAKLFLTTTLSNAAVGKVCDAELNSTTPCYIDFSADL